MFIPLEDIACLIRYGSLFKVHIIHNRLIATPNNNNNNITCMILLKKQCIIKI